MTKLFLVTAILFLCFQEDCFAKKNKHNDIKLIQCYEQRILAGRNEAGIEINYEILAVWQGKKAPISLFFKNETDWKNCKIFRVTRKNLAADQATLTIEISPEEIKRGDSLLIQPISGGRYTMPKHINARIKKALFYQTTNSNWLFHQINKTERKEDIVMP